MAFDQDEEIQELESSTNSTQDDTPSTQAEPVQADTPQEPAGDSAASSTAAKGDDDDLLSVVRDAVQDSKPEDAASPAEGEGDGQPTDADDPKEKDDESYSDVPFNKHPRFRELLAQRNEYKQDAERFREVQSFLNEHGLSADEAAEGLIIMGLMKVNPVEAWKRLKPTIEKLLVHAGEVLPQDLQQMVSAGQLDRAAALEISRARANVQAVQFQRSFEQQRQAQQQQMQAVMALRETVADWEGRRRRNDPNFDAKMEDLEREVLWLQQREGKPTTPEGVRAQLDKAYKAVNARFRAPAADTTQAQRKPAVRPVTGGQAVGKQVPSDASTLDIIKAHRRSA